jgi:hypothetical protein
MPSSALNGALLSAAVAVTPGTWPQWGGPNRDFKVEVSGLASAWPAAGPPRVWRRPLGEGYSAIVAGSGTISTPAWDGKSLLFCSSACDVGSRVLELTRPGGRTEVKQLWANRRFRVHKDNAMWIGDRVYGWSGDFGPSVLTAADGRTGSLAWHDRTFAKARFVHADGKLIALDEDGNLGLATVSAAGPKVLARFPLMKGRSWTVPTLVGTRLYARDRQEIVALELGG